MKDYVKKGFLACGGRPKNFLEFAVWAYNYTDSMPLGEVAEKYRAKHPELRTVDDSESVARGTKIMYEEWLKVDTRIIDEEFDYTITNTDGTKETIHLAVGDC